MLKDLLNSLPQQGKIEWIGLRPARREIVQSVTAAKVTLENALAGDRFAGRAGAKRQVTLIQWEHLRVIAELVGLAQVAPEVLRRNIAVSGLNLLALKGRQFHIGSAILEHTGSCEPCSRMEETLGPGGYNAMRGHGGITARIIQSGEVRIGDHVSAILDDSGGLIHC